MTVTDDPAITLTSEDLLGLYEQMEVIRRTEKAAHDLFLAGLVKGTTHLAAEQVGADGISGESTPVTPPHRAGSVLDADPAQMPGDAAIGLGWLGNDQPEHGYVAVTVIAGMAERVVQLRPPPRGGHQAGLNQREPVEEPCDIGAAP
jgi:hypothetical protein